MKQLWTKGRFSVLFAWFDFWIGAYYDVGHRTLYVNPLPMLVLRYEFPGQKDENKHRPDRQVAHPYPTGKGGDTERSNYV